MSTTAPQQQFHPAHATPSQVTVRIGLAVVCYAAVSALGHWLIHQQGIAYNDRAIMWAGIPHMVVLAIFVAVIQRRQWRGHHLWAGDTAERPGGDPISPISRGELSESRLDAPGTAGGFASGTGSPLAPGAASPLGPGDASAPSAAMDPSPTPLAVRPLNKAITWGLRLLLVTVLLAMVAPFVESAARGMFDPMLFAGLVLALLIGFSEEGLDRKFILDHAGDNGRRTAILLVVSVVLFSFMHMVNVAAGMRPADALNQSLMAIPFGLVAAIIYVATRQFWVLALWHANIDFQLFATNTGDLYAASIIGFAVDAAAIVTLVGVLVLWGQRLRATRKEKERSRG